MIIYLVFAHDLYIYFILKNGKPILVNAELPAAAKGIKFHIDTFKPTVYDGQNLYSMIGWAFSTADPAMRPEDYERNLVLVSGKKNYIFPTISSPRLSLQKAYQSLGMELTNAGFSTIISQDVIKPGIYRIGIIFHDHHKGSSSYTLTNKYLIRTPNQTQVSLTPTLSPTPAPPPLPSPISP